MSLLNQRGEIIFQDFSLHFHVFFYIWDIGQYISRLSWMHGTPDLSSDTSSNLLK